jgi:hypothetical protein
MEVRIVEEINNPDRFTVTLSFIRETSDQSLSQSLSQDDLLKILTMMSEPVSAKVVREKMGFKDSTYFKNTYIDSLPKEGLIESITISA